MTEPKHDENTMSLANQALRELARRELVRRRIFGYGVHLDDAGNRVKYGTNPTVEK